eukprot:jgi/Chrzof1/5794/Cz16g16040.t1
MTSCYCATATATATAAAAAHMDAICSLLGKPQEINLAQGVAAGVSSGLDDSDQHLDDLHKWADVFRITQVMAPAWVAVRALILSAGGEGGEGGLYKHVMLLPSSEVYLDHGERSVVQHQQEVYVTHGVAAFSKWGRYLNEFTAISYMVLIDCRRQRPGTPMVNG